MLDLTLELIAELNWTESVKIEPIMKEANEILAIFTSISNKFK
jgi:hypothetical protein